MSRWLDFGFEFPPGPIGLPITTPLLGLWLAIKERVEKLQLPFQIDGNTSHIQDLSSISYDELLGIAYRGRTALPQIALDDYSLAACIGHFCYWFWHSYLRNENTGAGYFANFKLFMMNEVGDPNDLVNITWSDFETWLANEYGVTYSELINYLSSYPNNFGSNDGLCLLYRLVNRIHFSSNSRIRYFEKKGNKASYRYVESVPADEDHTAYENAVAAILSTDWTSYELSADNDRQLPDAWNVRQIGSFGTSVYSSTTPRTSTITQRWLLDGTDPTTSGVYDGFGYPLTGGYLPASAVFGIDIINPSSWPSGPVFPDLQPWRVPNSGWYMVPFKLDPTGGYYANPFEGMYLDADQIFTSRHIRLQYNDVIVDAATALEFYDPE